MTNIKNIMHKQGSLFFKKNRDSINLQREDW